MAKEVVKRHSTKVEDYTIESLMTSVVEHAREEPVRDVRVEHAGTGYHSLDRRVTSFFHKRVYVSFRLGQVAGEVR